MNSYDNGANTNNCGGLLSPMFVWHTTSHKLNITTIDDAAQLPSPYRTLLSHSHLMTHTLARHHQSQITLTVHGSKHDTKTNTLSRCITLHAQPTPATTTQLPFHCPAHCPFQATNLNNSNTYGLCGCFDSCACFAYAGVVELGYITIYIDNIADPQLRHDTLTGTAPFGQLLTDYSVDVRCELQAVIQVDNVDYTDSMFRHLLPNKSASPSHTVYGRVNRLIDANDRVLADVVELIPAIHQSL